PATHGGTPHDPVGRQIRKARSVNSAMTAPPGAHEYNPLPVSDTFPLRPREIFDELRKVVVGQDEALRELSVALVKHLVGHPAPNILMIGNSGSGKTTLMRAVEQFLGGRPDLDEYANVVRIN